jgi:tellurite resistance protein TerC
MLGLDSVGTPALWIGFSLFVFLMLALDLGVFNRKTHVIKPREAAIWSAVWVGMALAFNGFVYWKWGTDVGQSFLTGYLLEKALSVDNLFVFYLLFSAFAVPLAYQHKLLFYGVLGALGLRLLMVVGGSWLLSRFHFLVIGFGVVLIWTGVRMFRRHDDHPHPEKSRLFRGFKRVVRTTEKDHGSKFFARENGVVHATPLLLVLVLIEATDVVFALDSILAIFAITEDPFIVFTSNIFAVMGLRSLYFLLAGVASRFVYLQPGLAIVLVFVGAKMAASQWVKLPVLVSLSVIVALLGGSIAASIVRERRMKKAAAGVLPAPHPSH